MTALRRALLALAAVLAMGSPALAVQPDEVLADPALEARARDLSKGLRCLVCRNESIDESNADLARELRIVVRERLVAGDSDAQIIDYLVSRYGEYVLLTPRADGSNLILWGAPILLILIGGGVAAAAVTRQRRPPEAALDPAEEARLRELLDD
ncbi:cytochrome c-type biogenesis protein [Jannaschia rubra]|uniref:Cytochrome c-type biogenesis protein n=1 Tax=Jannaschia rubra TaxID=282197 RepID=A0A0M6XT32_9RHOB|nr:cytochrome c-type biogenesis protein [Jannaschia rubra]CTQ34250.1 Cytochrome c-type biogenesis protein CcmH precursor [Jannaschia rubra]SFG19526.1 cytochrome c-type biogenesis protein CcmH [Jannaschia rubra]